MANLYFDESIRDNGKFIIGAVVISEEDLSTQIRAQWELMGLNPNDEYKSSAIKSENEVSVKQREFIRSLLHSSKLALVVLPSHDRKELGNYCAELVLQLLSTKKLFGNTHNLFVDENVFMNKDVQLKLDSVGVNLYLNSDSKKEAGIQLADHASHALGGMLEEMGLIKKQVKAGENSGYHPDEMLDLGFELWASLRYALIGDNQYIEGLSPPDDPANPYFMVNGYGLYIAASCVENLESCAKKRFGINYLGCIH
ncbi:hypothetical protein HGO26_01640 [Shewanella sp. S-1]|uniref:DUF3800 domain-containing protein n=1 Tax=Shewanella oncorhynchi TaxID=2726434 RepID=A0ABX1KHT5_9GAMM|nr:hypothetical protein [Shewanella oncorhynchi]NLQ21583.1 hypothetical protein [Shewanella oncorhynchi]